MTMKFELEFDDFEDFQSFIEKHERTINGMGNEEDKLSEQIMQQVAHNKQLPEYFTFADEQYEFMLRNYEQGISKMVNDNRVSVQRNPNSE